MSIGFRILFVLFLVANANAQAPGQITPAVKCAKEPACSYAVYLPSSYDGLQPVPALFMLDPMARGTEAVEAAKAVAETHGVAIFASNDSRNGTPIQKSFMVAAAMWNDAHQRFKLDPLRAYAAGFSGGARAAIAFAAACGECLNAVIANSGGLPNGMVVAQLKTPAFFTAGDLDFNYPEVVRLRSQLLKAGKPSRLFVFHGGHRWAPEEAWQQAFAWIELLEMKRGVTSLDLARVQAIRQQLHQYTESARKDFSAADAYRAEESEALDLASIEGLKEPPALPTAKAALNEEQKEFDAYFAAQSDIQRDLSALRDPGAVQREMPVSSDVSSDSPSGPLARRDDALRDLRSRMANLSKKIDKEEHPSAADQRLMATMLAGCYETAERAMADNPDGAITLYTAVVDFARVPAGGHLGLARAYAVKGNEKKSLAETKAAIAGGVQPADVKQASELTKWLAKPEWQAVLTK